MTVDEGIELLIVEGNETGDRRDLTHSGYAHVEAMSG